VTTIGERLSVIIFFASIGRELHESSLRVIIDSSFETSVFVLGSQGGRPESTIVGSSSEEHRQGSG
jgi:hypothetical protein